jgi:hypothetical protein
LEQNLVLPFLSFATLWPAISNSPINIQLPTIAGKALLFMRHLNSR